MNDSVKLKLRNFEDADLLLLRQWLYEPHVARWYQDPESWMYEAGNRSKEFSWIHHFIAEYEGVAIGFCQYYAYSMSGETWNGNISTDGAFSIDYLIGNIENVGKGLGKKIIQALISKIAHDEDARCIIVQPDINNKASQGVLQSCGFVFDSDNQLFKLHL